LIKASENLDFAAIQSAFVCDWYAAQVAVSSHHQIDNSDTRG